MNKEKRIICKVGKLYRNFVKYNENITLPSLKSSLTNITNISLLKKYCISKFISCLFCCQIAASKSKFRLF